MKTKKNVEKGILNEPLDHGGYVSTDELIEFGKSKGWKFSILGKAPVPNNPVDRGDWIFMPFDMDNAIIPWNAKGKQMDILDAGLQPRAFVIAHEVKNKPPIIEDEQNEEMKPFHEKTEVIAKPKSDSLGKSKNWFNSILPMLPIFLIAMIFVDPILIAITDDYTWVELERWYV